ncbi:unnamed protein product [Heligmosomoides polygyrus]|uniref:Uncharacterized protein n=1 Tax=Heligmosomoides polygyrus TaxID=6339 RepID=A0A183GPC1_HELPZ|nr:unnamed protein product [Heligmosomoides polygyrus]
MVPTRLLWKGGDSHSGIHLYRSDTSETVPWKELSKLFFSSTVDEFIFLTISPTVDRLQKYLDEIKRLSLLRVFPKRSFKI